MLSDKKKYGTSNNITRKYEKHEVIREGAWNPKMTTEHTHKKCKKFSVIFHDFVLITFLSVLQQIIELSYTSERREREKEKKAASDRKTEIKWQILHNSIKWVFKFWTEVTNHRNQYKVNSQDVHIQTTYKKTIWTKHKI